MLDDHFMANVGSIVFLIAFAIGAWELLSSNTLTFKHGNLLKYVIIISLLYPIYGILEHMFTRS